MILAGIILLTLGASFVYGIYKLNIFLLRKAARAIKGELSK